mmetsp:Transcript_13289/g.29203  ORF Transcript_13289/g.29203 Transcript_13289/m.29203 type:complete len:257 (+) Transcript_13289:81-851(+)
MKAVTLWICIVFAALALVTGQDATAAATSVENGTAEKSLRGAEQGRRRTFDFLSLLFSLGHGPCHGPLDKHKPECKHHHSSSDSHSSSGGGSGGSSGGGSGGGSSGGGSSGGGSGSYSGGGSGGSSSGGSSSGGGSGGYSDYSSGGGGSDGGGAYAQEASSGPSSNRASASLNGIANQSLAGIMGVIAMVALGTAMAAMIVGQTKASKKKHPLEGAVQKRMGLFSSFVERHAASTEHRAEPRVVEMSAREGDYQLA